jgi:hypothetical protein
MAFADPQSITPTGGSAISLPLTSRGNDSAIYSSADGLVTELVSHAYGRRTRRQFRVNQSKITTDPFKPAENVKVGMSVYTVIDLPPAGFSVAEASALWTGFNTQLAAASNLLITKTLQGES